MTAKERLIKRLQELTKSGEFIVPGKVLSLDRDDKTCVVQLADDLKIEDVRLRSVVTNSNGLTVYPKEGSIVLIGQVGNESAGDFTVIKVEQVEEVDLNIGDLTLSMTKDGFKINGDKFGGLVDAKELKLQIAKNTAAIEAIRAMFTNWVPIPQDGGAVLKGLSTTLNGLQLADLSKIENEKVKHG